MKNLIINNLKLIIFSIILISLSEKIISSENKIIFRINDKAITSFDLNQRIKYLEFIGNNSDLTKETIIDDFISANMFYEYFKKTKSSSIYNDKIDEIYDKIKELNKKNNKKFDNHISEDIIKLNIKIDYIRKTILENFINSNFNNFNKSDEELDLLYKFNLTYINFESDIYQEILNKINLSKNIDINKIKLLLNNNDINFFIKQKEVDNINNLDKRISKNIIANNNFFYIKNKNKISLILIDKKFETLEGIIVNLYSVKTNNELNKQNLNCNNLIDKNDKENIISKEYNFSNLNNELKNNLININDYVKFNSDNEIIYVVLCEIKFDKNILVDFNFNKIINSNVKDIELKFIAKYSKEYNLKKINE